MINASKTNAKKQAVVAIPAVETHLRVLSNNQRKMVTVITRDWQKFTGSVFSEMFDKI